MAFLQIPFRAFPGGFRSPTFFGRRQIDAGAASLRQTDGDRLFGGAGSVLALADVLHLFTDKFARLC